MSPAILALVLSMLFGNVVTDEVAIQNSMTKCQQSVMSNANAENSKECGVDLVYGF
jgi:hypothetical protein